MCIYKGRHENVRRIHGRNTRAADEYNFTRERYHNNKSKTSPCYKGALSWDKLPVNVKQCLTLIEFKKALTRLYRQYNDQMS